MAAEPYPLRFDIDYPETLGRLSTAFRLLLIIPIAIVLVAVVGTDYDPETQDEVMGVGFLVAAPLIMILFCRKYPRWWFDWNRELARFIARVDAYLFLLTDRYPSTDEQQSIHLEIAYPDAERDLNRWLPLVKWLLAVPHLVVLALLWIAVLLVTMVVWFVILATGRYPREPFEFVVGVMRWTWRVLAYAVLMVTDEYPPFRLAA